MEILILIPKVLNPSLNYITNFLETLHLVFLRCSRSITKIIICFDSCIVPFDFSNDFLISTICPFDFLNGVRVSFVHSIFNWHQKWHFAFPFCIYPFVSSYLETKIKNGSRNVHTIRIYTLNSALSKTIFHFYVPHSITSITEL